MLGTREKLVYVSTLIITNPVSYYIAVVTGLLAFLMQTSYWWSLAMVFVLFLIESLDLFMTTNWDEVNEQIKEKNKK